MTHNMGEHQVKYCILYKLKYHQTRNNITKEQKIQVRNWTILLPKNWKQ